MNEKIDNFINYIKGLFHFYFNKERIQIIGLKKEDYPFLLNLIEKYLQIYKIDKIRIIVVKRGFNAGTFSFFGDRILISKKIFEELNEKEIEGVIAHEFAHAYYRDYFLSVFSRLIVFIPFLYFLRAASMEPNNPFLGFLMIITFFIWIYGFRIINWMGVEFETFI